MDLSNGCGEFSELLNGFVDIWISLSCYMDFFKLDSWISLSCYMDFSELTHGFLKVAIWICLSC